MADGKISVLVSGNPNANSGFQTLINKHNPSFVNDDKPDRYPGFNDNGYPYFISIKTDDAQTVYRFIKNGVRSYSANRGGVLIIAFSIPQGYKLDGGKTPYDVLCKLKDVFLERGMMDQMNGVYQYANNSLSAYDHILDDVVAEFNLISDPSIRYKSMTGSQLGLIMLSEGEIKELFKDIRYPEFAACGEIVVTTQCSSPANYRVLNVKIPRPIKYRIYKDNSDVPCDEVDESDFNKEIPVKSNKPEEYYQNTTQTFTINQLLSKTTPNPPYVVKVDEWKEEIWINTSKIPTSPRRKEVVLDINPKQLEGEIRDKLKLKDAHGYVLPQKEGKIVFEAEKIAVIRTSNIIAYIQGDDRYVLRTRWEGERLVIDVGEKPKPQSPVPQPNYGGGVSQGVVGGCAHNVSELCVDITIELTDDFFRKVRKGSQIWVTLKDNYNKDEIIFHRKVYFKKTDSGWMGQFTVLKSQCDGTTLVIETGKRTLRRQIQTDNNVRLKLKQEHFVETKMSPYNRHKEFYNYFIIPLSMIALGCIVGFFLHFHISGKCNSLEVRGFLDTAKVVLMRKDLSFAQIDTVCSNVSLPKEDLQQYAKIQSYMDLCNAVRKGDIAAIKSYVGNPNIDEVHKGMIGRIVRDEKSEKRFSNKYRDIESFVGISEIYKYPCEECGEYFDTDEEKTHKKIHCNSNGCDRVFCTQDALTEHKKVHQSNRSGRSTDSKNRSNNDER